MKLLIKTIAPRSIGAIDYLLKKSMKINVDIYAPFFTILAKSHFSSNILQASKYLKAIEFVR